MKVKKRDGSLVDFDKTKIINAIDKAGYVVAIVKRHIADEIAEAAEATETPPISVETIQDLVEEKLMQKGYANVAREYIRYRYKRELIRNTKGALSEVLDIVNLCNQNVKDENSNKNPVILSTQRDYMAGMVSKELSERLLFPPDVMKAHKEGIIHVHDMDYTIQKMYNCFEGNTELITDEGIKKFKELRDGQIIEVLTKEGKWSKATVHNYGKQPVQIVTLALGNNIHEIKCTKNHRWFLSNGSTTTDLKVNDTLMPLAPLEEYLPNSVREYKMFCLGFILGDGCDRDNGYCVRLCGDKIKYVKFFIQSGFRVNTYKNSSDLLCSKITNMRKQLFLNNQEWQYLSKEDKIALFHGYYAADGSQKQNCIFTSDIRIVQMLKDIAPLARYNILNIKKIKRDTNYKEDALLYKIQFLVRQYNHTKWKVINIKPYRGKTYTPNVWCVEEPTTHSFTLAKGIITGNCALLDMEDMLQNGTVINGTLIERPHSFATACNIATQIMAQVASNQYGGQSVSVAHLAPFVDVSRKRLIKEVHEEYPILCNAGIFDIAERRLKDEIKRGVQTMQYQINTLMTSNGQTPFVTLWLYLNEAKSEQEKKDLAMVIEEIIRQRYQGVKNEKGAWVAAAFPKLIYALEEDNCKEGTPYWYLTKLCAACTAKRMQPDYVSEKIMLENKKTADGVGHCYPPMGCRSFLTPYLDENGKAKFYGRWNQGVVTINLVDVGLSAMKDESKFWSILDERLELCHRALRVKHQQLKGTISNVSPIHWQHGAIARLQKGETIDKLLYGGYSTISLGYAGLYECCLAMKGKTHTDPDVKPFALAVLQRLNDKCAEWKAEENIGYSVYGTPMETTTYKFAQCLQKRFGFIKDITDHDYITNSYHVNVREKIDPFTKLSFESEFQLLSPGGAISYIECADMTKNLDAVLEVIKFIYNNIMYAELNTKSDFCQVCGYDGEIKIITDHGRLEWECPKCGNRDKTKMNVLRRTCGYLGSQFWNQGRTEEIKDRFIHLGGDYDV